MEYSGLLEHIEQQKTAAIGVHWARRGRMNGHEILLVANGAGWRRAALAVDAALPFRPDAIVSTGFCGALDPQLRAGDVVVGDSVIARGRKFAAKIPGQANRLRHVGAVASVDHVVRMATEKRKLRAEGNTIVEMEAAGAAEKAEALGIPLYCVRAATDLADEDLANDFNVCIRPDGHFDTMRIFRHALGQPAARIPELLRLRRNSKRAALTLGEFFADCRF